MRLQSVSLVFIALTIGGLSAERVGAAEAADTLALLARSRVPDAADPQTLHVVHKPLAWEARKTAVIVCDMWDKHWCRGASQRVAEMAPRMNDLLVAARKRGALIVHAPSDTMDFYRDTPQRKLALAAPAVTPKTPLARWRSLDPQREGPLPIDDRAGGCDTPGDRPGKAWQRQIETLRIEPGDAIGDGFEVFNLLEQRGIENVLILGVHTNMCVLGRPFGIRQLVTQGKNVALVRDLTDAMYDPQSPPKVSHFRGTDLVIEHIERHWCPTVTSADLLGGTAFRFAADRRPHVVFLVNEDEYAAAETLADFAALLAARFDWHASFVTGRGKHDLSGVEALKTADAAVLYVRRQALPAEQLAAVRAYLDAGKPLVALRTASHAFAVRGTAPEDRQQWPAFDREVLGCEYSGHTGNALGADVTLAADAAAHAILTGVAPQKWHSTGSLYKSAITDPKATVLLTGAAGDFQAPVAWARLHGKGRVFYTSLGHRDDFAQPQFRQLLINALHWAMDRPPSADRP
jgi:type 1 glutamine amidotransferase/nicotinamidase-related amidase